MSYGLSDAGRSGKGKSSSVHGPYVVVKVKMRFSGRGITGRQFCSTPHILWGGREGLISGASLHEGPHPTQACRRIEALPTFIAVDVDTTPQA